MIFKSLFVILLSVSGVLCWVDWGVTYTPERICALNGSTVNMGCTYSYPTNHNVQKTFWFIHWHSTEAQFKDLSKDPEYSHRVEYLGNKNNDCTFRINQVRESDSETYHFRFLTDQEKYYGKPGVTLEVTDLQVMVSPGTVTEGERVTLTCRTTCTLTDSPTFIWYRNESPLPFSNQQHQFTASSEDAGKYSCAVKGYEHLSSPAVTLTVRYPPKNISVSVSPSGVIKEGSSVTLTCSSDANPPVNRYTWYKNNRTVSSETGGPEESYIIKNITQQDAGEYCCKAENGMGTNSSPPKLLDVQYPPKNISVSVSPSGVIKDGSSVTLTCSSDANPPVNRYTWYQKNETGVWLAGSGQSLNFSGFKSWNSGQYYCGVQNTHGAHNSTALLLTVQGGQSLIVAVAVGGAAIVGFVFLCVVCVSQRRKSMKETGHTEGDRKESKSPVYDNVTGMAVSHTETQGTDRGNGEAPLYSSVQKPLPQREDDVQYASIQLHPSRAAHRSPVPTVNEDCILYSAIRKHDT